MNDAISQSAAIQALKKAKELASEPPTHFDIYIHKTFDLCIRLIAAFDAVDAVPVVHARFGFVGPDLSGYRYDTRYGTCSACKRRIVFVTNQTNFCPNCGARMDGEADG